MASYTRQSSFADGDTITAALFNNEFTQLVNAFHNSTGHAHDGTTAEGPVIGLIGDAGETAPNNKVLIDTTNNYIEFYVQVSSSPVQQLYIADGAIVPVTDSDVDLGTSSLYFKDAYIDSITTTGNVAVGGNLTVTGTTTFNGGTITMGDAATDNVVFGADVDSNIIPDDDDTYDLGSSSQQWRNLYIDGTANIDSLVADTADINGGTVDGAVIGGSSAAAITGTTITGTSFVIGSADINEAELETIDGVTAGTVAASKAIVVDSNKDFTGARNITLTGELDAGSLDVSGDVDVDGTLETDALSINGTAVTSTAAELNYLDITTLGTTEASKAVTTDANGDILLPDSDKIKFGAGSDLQIYHDGSNSFVADAGTGQLRLLGDDVRIMNAAGTEISAQFIQDGEARLKYDNSTKLATKTGGIQVTGDISNASGDFTLDVAGDINLDADDGTFRFRDGGTNLLSMYDSSGFTLQTSTNNGDLHFKGVDDSSIINALTLDMSDAGTAIFNHDITLPDDGKAIFGAGSDLQIYHDGSNSYITDVGTGALVIQSNGTAIVLEKTDGENMILANPDGDVKLYYNGSAKLATASDGIDVTGHIDSATLTTTGNVVVGGDLTVQGTTTTLNTATLDVEDKNITVNAGAGDTSGSANGAGLTIQDAVDASTDATILWDATNDEFDFSHPINVTGKVTGTGTSVFTNLDISGDIDVDGTTNLDVVDIDGAVDFASTTAHAGNATFADNAKAIFGAGSELQIYHNGRHSNIRDAGT